MTIKELKIFVEKIQEKQDSIDKKIDDKLYSKVDQLVSKIDSVLNSVGQHSTDITNLQTRSINWSASCLLIQVTSLIPLVLNMELILKKLMVLLAIVFPYGRLSLHTIAR